MATRTVTLQFKMHRHWWGRELRSTDGRISLHITYWDILKYGRAHYNTGWPQLLVKFAYWYLTHG